MNYLSHQKSFNIAENFFSQFGYCGEKMAKKFLSKRPKTFLCLTFVPHSFPTLWYPQRKYAKYINDVFDDFITFDWSHPNELLLETKFLPSVAEFFQARKIHEIYAIMSFNSTGENNRVEILRPEEIVDKLASVSFDDNYLFPADFSWLFCNTHEHFSFLAGSKNFVKSFIKLSPYILRYDSAREYLNKPSK